MSESKFMLRDGPWFPCSYTQSCTGSHWASTNIHTHGAVVLLVVEAEVSLSRAEDIPTGSRNVCTWPNTTVPPYQYQCRNSYTYTSLRAASISVCTWAEESHLLAHSIDIAVDWHILSSLNLLHKLMIQIFSWCVLVYLLHIKVVTLIYTSRLSGP